MASKAYKGVVAAVYEKPWTDRDTGDEIVLHSFQLDNEKRYFRTGTERLGEIKEGKYISFTADARSNNVDVESVTEAEGSPPTRAPKAKGKSNYSKSSGGSRDSYWEDKARRDVEITEPRISYSAAQKNATELVVAALNHDLLSFGNAAKGKKLDMMIDFVEQATVKLAALQMQAPEIMKEIDSE